jgi:cell wall-associated NlpC family hydrolase
MPSVIAVAAVAPLQGNASVRAEQTNQLVLGETGTQLERQGEWIRLCTHRDEYEGWVHAGYLRVVDDAKALAWRNQAQGWSDGLKVGSDNWEIRLPLRARFALLDGLIVLPDGRQGPANGASPRLLSQVISEARHQAPERWALEHFRGAPYQWGGVTPWGVDCSGLVQTTFAARGVNLPRDAAQQVNVGSPASLDDIRPGDLLYFSSETGSGAITHVAFAGDATTLVHSTLACGGVVVESSLPGSRATSLMQRLVAVRRMEAR